MFNNGDLKAQETWMHEKENLFIYYKHRHKLYARAQKLIFKNDNIIGKKLIIRYKQCYFFVLFRVFSGA